MQDEQGVVLLCFFITMASTMYPALTNESVGTPPHQLPVGRTFVSVFLFMLGASIVAEIDGRLGATLAVMVAGYTFFAYGLPSINAGYGKKKK